MGNHSKKYGYVTADETKIATVTNAFKDIGPLNTPLSSLVYTSGSVSQTYAEAPYGGKQWLIDTVRGSNGNYGGYLRSTNSGGVFDLGTGDFTVETYFYSRLSSNDQAVISISPLSSGWAGLLMYARTSSFYARIAVTTSGPAWSVDGVGSYSINTWNHYAMTRSGNTFRVYANGSKIHEVTTSAISLKTSSYLNLNGIYPGQGGYSTFYFKDFRLIKGTALYTGDSFTPQQMPSYNEYANTVYIPGNNITNKGVAVATNRNKFLNRVRTIGTI